MRLGPTPQTTIHSRCEESLKPLKNLVVVLIEHSVCFRVAWEAGKLPRTDSIAVVGCGVASLVLDSERQWVELHFDEISDDAVLVDSTSEQLLVTHCKHSEVSHQRTLKHQSFRLALKCDGNEGPVVLGDSEAHNICHGN